MPENLLTDLKVRSAKSTDRDWKLSDGEGLFLLVKPTGGKLWRRPIWRRSSLSLRSARTARKSPASGSTFRPSSTGCR